MVLDTKCLYDFYEEGFWCGIKFTYIPDGTDEEMGAWTKGFEDAVRGERKKTIEEFEDGRNIDGILYR